MPDMRFIPRDDLGKESWLRNFAAKLPNYAPACNISPAEVAQTAADAAVFSYIVGARRNAEGYARALTARRDALRAGKDLGEAGPCPTPPNPGPEPAGARGGIFARVARLARRIKARSVVYNGAVGVDLGIVSAKKTDDLATIQPHLTVKIAAGHPVIRYRIGRMTGIEIHVDRTGHGEFVKLDDDTRPPYRDTAPLPPGGTAAVWSYKAMYKLRDERVGQWSNIVQIAVAGF